MGCTPGPAESSDDSSIDIIVIDDSNSNSESENESMTSEMSIDTTTSEQSIIEGAIDPDSGNIAGTSTPAVPLLMQENVAGPSTCSPSDSSHGNVVELDRSDVQDFQPMQEHVDSLIIDSNIVDLSFEMISVPSTEERERPVVVSEVRSIRDTTIGQGLINVETENAVADNPAIESAFCSNPKNDKNITNGIGSRFNTILSTQRDAAIAGPSTSSSPHGMSVPLLDGLERSNVNKFDQSSSNRRSLFKFENVIDQKPFIKIENGVDRKPIVSTLDHKPFPLNFDHAPFVETKPDIRDLNSGQAASAPSRRTYTNPPKIPGLNKTLEKFSYRGLDIGYDINAVYLDLLDYRGVDDEDFYLFCATYGLLDHNWNSCPSIDDRIKQGYWPAQVYYNQMLTSVLVFCISDQEILERITRERSPLSVSRAGLPLIDRHELLRRSERISNGTQEVVYRPGHDSDSD